ncbi:putative potassium transport system protein kup 2 [Alphaproteobacteria bacterium]
MQKKTENGVLIGAIGVVFGDIGTSPLYTLKMCFQSGSIAIDEVSIISIISLIFWSLTIIITFKYIGLILRADNNGEGGTLALVSLIKRSSKNISNQTITTLGILAMAFFYGDSVITPAISVLGALEGLSVVTSKLDHVIVPLSIFLLLMLFLLQKKGTAKISHFFGPIMLLWFITIAFLGLAQIIKMPKILLALNPFYAINFLFNCKFQAFHVLGGVFLVLTGAEALYADLGHFNRSSIRISWLSLVFPALVMNYLGQGALLLMDHTAIANPFYLLVPSWAMYPVIILATISTIIASQSVISGFFSMSWQAIQLKYLPRIAVIHTSSNILGQVYLPFVNYLLLTLTVLSVLLFRSSNNLAYAYGMNITGIFIITTFLAAVLFYYRWNWSLLKTLLIFTPLLFIDASFFIASILKILDGTWFPLMIATIAFIIITTWYRGSSTLAKINTNIKVKLIDFINNIRSENVTVIPGTAVYMSKIPIIAPNAFKINIKHNKCLHKTVFFLSVIVKNVPEVLSQHRIKINTLKNDIYQLIAYYGFMETPNIDDIFKKVIESGIDIKLDEISFFLSREILIASKTHYLTRWRKRLFILLANNAMSVTDFFKIPHKRTVELCTRFRI